jgi:hypothetical protein
MANEKKPSENRTATQRIADLENAIMSLFHVNDNLTRDVMVLKDAIKLLDNKVNSIVKASAAGESLSDEVLTRIMTQNNVEELAQKVTSMVAQGFLVQEEQVSENSFVVGTEIDDEGKLQNPRLQFALKAIAPEYQAKLLGAKAGDTLLLKEGKLSFRVVESYKIQEPQAEQAPAQEAALEAPVQPEQEATPAATN